MNNKPKRRALHGHPVRQQGVTLVVALVLLLVVSLLGISAMRSTTLEVRMASNNEDHSIAFQAAEAALQTAIADIDTAIEAGFADDCDSGYCTAADGNDSSARWEDSSLDVWNDADKHQQLADDDVVGVASAPKYIVEKMDYTSTTGSSPSLVTGYGATRGGAQNYYRITSRGTGASDSAVVMLQGIYVK